MSGLNFRLFRHDFIVYFVANMAKTSRYTKKSHPEGWQCIGGNL